MLHEEVGYPFAHAPLPDLMIDRVGEAVESLA
jgi:hypothetical protein